MSETSNPTSSYPHPETASSTTTTHQSPIDAQPSSGTSQNSTSRVADSTLIERHSPSGSVIRWWWSVLFGSILSLPFAWLLSYAAALPFFIGMFFFVLFGLIIGAAVFRVATSAAPYPARSLVIGTTIIVLIAWTVTIVKESRDFPDDIAHRIGNQTRDIGDRSIDEFHTMVADQIRQFLRHHYPPGGTIGYIHWVLTDGMLQAGDFDTVRRTIRAPERKFWWAVRAALSVGLLAFGIGSQTLTLKEAVAAHVPSRT